MSTGAVAYYREMDGALRFTAIGGYKWSPRAKQSAGGCDLLG